MEFWGGINSEEEKCLRYYALICNLDVLLYIVNNAAADPQTSCPWGNHRTFIDLIEEHSACLADTETCLLR